MNNITDILIQLAFELGQAYQRIYTSAGLDNAIDFNNIAFANSCGAQLKSKGDMSNLPKLFKVHQLNNNKINALNEIAQDLQKVKAMAKEKSKGVKYMNIKINGTKSDLSAMLLSTERYALGRQTYIVEWTCEFISNNLHLLLEKDKKVMIRDIKQQEEYGYGEWFDKEEWMKLLKVLEESL